MAPKTNLLWPEIELPESVIPLLSGTLRVTGGVIHSGDAVELRTGTRTRQATYCGSWEPVDAGPCDVFRLETGELITRTLALVRPFVEPKPPTFGDRIALEVSGQVVGTAHGLSNVQRWYRFATNAAVSDTVRRLESEISDPPMATLCQSTTPWDE